MAKDNDKAAREEKKHKKEKHSATLGDNGVKKSKHKDKSSKKHKPDQDSSGADAILDTPDATKTTSTAEVAADGVKVRKEKEVKMKDLQDGEKMVTERTRETVEPDADAMDVDRTAKFHVGPIVPFADPLADDKTLRRVLRGVKKGAKYRTLRRGVKEVTKTLRKAPDVAKLKPGQMPLAITVLAADISPPDVISHLPVTCEDHGVPYIFVPSRAALGAAGMTKRPTSVVMLVRDPPPVRPKKGTAEKEKAGEDEKDEGSWAEVFEELVKTINKTSKRIRY